MTCPYCNQQTDPGLRCSKCQHFLSDEAATICCECEELKKKLEDANLLNSRFLGFAITLGAVILAVCLYLNDYSHSSYFGILDTLVNYLFLVGGSFFIVGLGLLVLNDFLERVIKKHKRGASWLQYNRSMLLGHFCIVLAGALIIITMIYISGHI